MYKTEYFNCLILLFVRPRKLTIAMSARRNLNYISQHINPVDHAPDLPPRVPVRPPHVEAVQAPGHVPGRVLDQPQRQELYK